MGMSVKEFECGTFYDITLRIEGFKQRLAWEENLFRNTAYSAYIGPHINPKNLKGMSLEKFWGIPEMDSKKKAPKLTPDRRKRISDTIKELQINGKAGS